VSPSIGSDDFKYSPSLYRSNTIDVGLFPDVLLLSTHVFVTVTGILNVSYSILFVTVNPVSVTV
jgi:hypothetical protein